MTTRRTLITTFEDGGAFNYSVELLKMLEFLFCWCGTTTRLRAMLVRLIGYELSHRPVTG